MNNLLNKVHCLPALELLRGIGDNSIDVIVTDPPYGIDYEAGHDVDFSGLPRKTERTFGADTFDPTWLSEARRVLKPTGAMYLCTHWRIQHKWLEAIEAAGMCVAQKIVWDKGHWGQGDLRYFGPQCEELLFVPMPEHKLREKRRGNVWRIGGQGNVWNEAQAKYHPTQKPIKLFEVCIRFSSDVDGVVLDPFAGSGTAAVAAVGLRRQFIVGEILPEYCAVARKRIETPRMMDMFAQVVQL